jgi:hypothetical protein
MFCLPRYHHSISTSVTTSNKFSVFINTQNVYVPIPEREYIPIAVNANIINIPQLGP